MTISPETFLSILESLRSDAVSRGGEKRAEPRVGLSGRATIKTPAGTFAPVMVRDLSRGGIGMLEREPMKVGSRFTLCFAASRDAEECEGVICEVTRCDRISESVHAVGARFIEQVTVPLRGGGGGSSRETELDAMMRQMEQARRRGQVTSRSQ
jgi:hypothetical protein